LRFAVFLAHSEDRPLNVFSCPRANPAFALLLITLVVGCARAPHERLLDERLRAAGLPDQLELRVEGDPLDDGDGDGHAADALHVAEAVERALATSPDVQAALAVVAAARAESQQARLLPNPVINVAVRFPEDSGRSIIEAGVSEDVLAILLRPRRIGAADNRLGVAISEAVSTVLDVLVEVQQTYADARALDAQLAVLNERRQIVGRLLDLARSRVEAGESSRLDVITFEADRASLEVEIAEKSAEARQRRLELARLTGRPTGAADWALPPWSAEPVTVVNEIDWINTALRQRPEVQARQWELAALGDDLEVARWAVFEGVELGAEAEREDDWSIGPAVAAPLPLFDFGQARRRRARAQVIEARHRLTQTRRLVVQEVRQAAAGLTAAQAALAKVQNELVPLQERRREHAEAAYRNGLADITTVLLAEQEAQATRSKVIELQRKVSFARVQLERAVGGPGFVAQLQPAATQPTTSATTQASP
jgi:outer membrane protein TolC